jgi:hypothetical protein
MNADWSIAQDIIPRNLFPALSLPPAFVRFTRYRRRRLAGFVLYRETAAVAALPAPYAEAMRHGGRGSIWRRYTARSKGPTFPGIASGAKRCGKPCSSAATAASPRGLYALPA